MRARDYNSIFNTGRKFRPDYGLLLELHALTLVARSYALLITCMHHLEVDPGEYSEPFGVPSSLQTAYILSIAAIHKG